MCRDSYPSTPAGARPSRHASAAAGDDCVVRSVQEARVDGSDGGAPEKFDPSFCKRDDGTWDVLAPRRRIAPLEHAGACHWRVRGWRRLMTGLHARLPEDTALAIPHAQYGVYSSTVPPSSPPTTSTPPEASTVAVWFKRGTAMDAAGAHEFPSKISALLTVEP